MLYMGESGGTSRRIPSYFFSEVLGEHVIFHVDTGADSYRIATQLLHPFGPEPCMLTQESSDQHVALGESIMRAVRAGEFLSDIRPTLPVGFAPRVILEKDKYIFVARETTETQPPEASSVAQRYVLRDRSRLELNRRRDERFHFQWSARNWIRFCAKVALESLCLFEGEDRCLSPAFDRVRQFVLEESVQPGREILFGVHGPIDDNDR